MNPFKGFPFERLRFEFERRERKIDKIKRQLRKTTYHSRGVTMDALAVLYRQEAERDAALTKDLETLEGELKQIEEAMNG